MKKLSVNLTSAMLLVFLISYPVFAQRTTTAQVFSIPQASIGSGKTLILGAEFYKIFNYQYGFSLNANYDLYQAPNLPDDYESGFTLFGDKNVVNTAMEINARALYALPVGNNMRLNLQAGPSLFIGEKSTFTPTSSSGLGSNYTVEEETKVTIGASLKAGLDIPISNRVGVGIHALGNVNSMHSYIAGGVSLQFGMVR